ncbi:Transposase IS116/IS110/IS902 family protein [Planctomycetes bacterium CA13]|uniref:Transposase IS116/IS110/IS902 family protein n=2 Tax=Novipirellula herctigrandis TaxID=2527986 RepID=A0A5C5YUC6_9BACT|nr:Transposase IS116/IS110/IS902 family protein [Planctomycetes bacterium CA13]
MNSTTNSMSKSTLLVQQNQNITDAGRIVNVGFDVGSDSLYWAMELSGKSIRGQCENNSSDIRTTLEEIRNEVQQHGDYQIRVLCESTGIYHRRLLQLADELGMRTALVHGEAVAKFRTIQFADHGKTDQRDPKAVLTVAKVGKLIQDRKLDKHYAQLRELHRLVLRCEARIKVAKCELHADLRSLFADLRLDKSVLYGPTGRALIEQFAGNPHAILAVGEEAFYGRMKACSKHTKKATLKKLWRAANDTASTQKDDLAATLAEIRATAVQQLYTEITTFLQQQRQIESQMQELYLTLQSSDPRLPAPRKGVVTLRMLSRLVAEMGPPDDFRTVSQLMRYAGLNLCERQSGKWRGRTTISRRGRSELRYVLNLMAIPLVGRGKLFGDYYWKKKEADKMPGQKANVCVMRKILKMFYGWYKSGEPFDPGRVFAMASEHAKAA